VMDGYEATRAVRTMESGALHTPIIALTASAMREDRARCLDAGMDDFLAKPVTLEQLGSTLGRWAPLPAPAASAPAAPAPPAAGPPPVAVDDQVLKDLLAVMNPEVVRELVTAFREDARAALDDLGAALQQGDLSSWRRISHRFRGSCATLGARGMMDLTKRMEALDPPALNARGASLREELQAELNRVEDALGQTLP